MDCKTYVAGMPTLSVDDEWAHGNYVASLEDGKVVIYEKENGLKRTVAEISVGDEFKRVAFDGKTVYLCGDYCEALSLDGRVIWTSPVSFDDGEATPLGLEGGLLFVLNDDGVYALSSSNGSVVYKIDAKPDGAAYCGKKVALWKDDWVAVYDGKELLWNATADWAPLKVVFSDDCKYLFVGSGVTLYALGAATGKVVDHYTASNLVVPLVACRASDVYGILGIEIPPSSLKLATSDSLLDGISMLVVVYAFQPS